MRMRLTPSALICGLIAGNASAQNIIDGDSNLTFGAAPATSLTVGGVAGNWMPQAWWWFRTDTAANADFQERLLTGAGSQTAPDTATFLCTASTPNGQTLDFDFGYVIQDGPGREARLSV